MFGMLFTTQREDRNARFDEVTLADGQVMVVPRANLAAAKALYAAQRAAERRMAQRAAYFAYDFDQFEASARELQRVG